jgi:hypothetical protein
MTSLFASQKISIVFAAAVNGAGIKVQGSTDTCTMVVRISKGLSRAERAGSTRTSRHTGTEGSTDGVAGTCNAHR